MRPAALWQRRTGPPCSTPQLKPYPSRLHAAPHDRHCSATCTSTQVLFFVVDEDGVARRGSAEGGSYTLEGDRLTFRHRYNLSAGEAMEGLPASELRMQLLGAGGEAGGEAVEPCTIEVSTRRLTIHFPSGNRMIFSRAT